MEQIKLYPAEPNAACLILGGCFIAASLILPSNHRHWYPDPSSFFAWSALILWVYYAITSFFGMYCFRIPANGIPRPSAGDRAKKVALVTVITLLAACVFHVIAVLFGAPIMSDHKNTFVGALIVALLAVTPSAIILKPSPSRWKNTLLLGSLETIPEKWASGLFWPTIVVTWISAYVIPLDWGREWQTWPIPCIMGAIIGHLFGIIFVFIRCWGINLAKQDFKESEAAKRLPFRKHHQE